MSLWPWCVLATILSSSLGYTQETSVISGSIHSLEKQLKDIKIVNLSRNTYSYSDANGLFTIGAELKDSIKFTSIFYEDKVIVVNRVHLKSELEISLVERVNVLEEVVLTEAYIAPDFDKNTYTANLQKQINTDRKKSPFKYGVLPNNGGNISNIIRLVAWLLKDEDKHEDQEQVRSVVFDDLAYLFKNDSFFTEELLTVDLKIPKDQIELFLMYCDSQGINAELLGEDHKFELLDQLVIHSKSFLARIKNLPADIN